MEVDRGAGEQEIKKLDPNKRIDTELRFLEPFKATNDAWFEITPEGNGSKVTWGFFATFKIPINIMMMFMNMEKRLGGDYEQGLKNFKEQAEKA